MHAQLCSTLCDPMDYSPPVSSSMAFSRQEYWSRLLFPSPGNLLDLGIEPVSPAWQADSLLLSHWGSPLGHLYVFFEEVPIRSSAHFSIGMFVFIVVELYELFVYFGK